MPTITAAEVHALKRDGPGLFDVAKVLADIWNFGEGDALEMTDPFSDAKILDSWRKNVQPWVNAVQRNQIESRRLVTDQAIVEAVMEKRPSSMLDVGCGEGWLCRAVEARGVRAMGVDAVAELIAAAKRAGAGEYHGLAYEQLAVSQILEPADVVVCNFSLIGKESVDAVFGAASQLLRPNGQLIIQTLHPASACGSGPYRDGWRQGSWAGFDASFTDPAPWYFRTLAGWLRLFRDSRLNLVDLREPTHPQTGQPVSLLFVLSARITPSGPPVGG